MFTTESQYRPVLVRIVSKEIVLSSLPNDRSKIFYPLFFDYESSKSEHRRHIANCTLQYSIIAPPTLCFSISAFLLSVIWTSSEMRASKPFFSFSNIANSSALYARAVDGVEARFLILDLGSLPPLLTFWELWALRNTLSDCLLMFCMLEDFFMGGEAEPLAAMFDDCAPIFLEIFTGSRLGDDLAGRSSLL